MGLYYTSKKHNNHKNAGITLVSISSVLLVVMILPFLKAVSGFIYGIMGLTIFPCLIITFLIGLALMSGRTFSMSAKNLTYLILSFCTLVLVLHTMFLTRAINAYGSVKISKFFDFWCKIINGSLGITVGGALFTLVSYPFISLLGVVGATIIFTIALTVFIGLTVDYYINLKSFYDKSRMRREHITRDLVDKIPTDTISESLNNNLTSADVSVPKKESKVFFSGEEPLEDIEPGDYLFNTEESPIETPLYNSEEDDSEEGGTTYGLFGKPFIKPSDDEDNLSRDEKATSKYDPNKFSSVNEYIKYPYVPSIFANNNKNQNEEEEDYASNSFSTEPEDEEEISSGGNFTSSASPFSFESLRGEDRENSFANNPRTPFIFNTIDNDFGTETRAERFDRNEEEGLLSERREREDSSPLSSPFVGYTPSDLRTREDRSNANRPQREESLERAEIKPKMKPEQIEIPGARNKPKTYKAEQDDKYNAPSPQLLDRREDDPTKYGSDFKEKSAALENILSSFKIDAKVVDVTRGPSVTQYELAMPFGISVKRVLQYDGDIAAALRSKKGIRIEAPIAGKNAVGVEVPNDSPSTVGLRELLESDDFTKSKAVLPFVVGKNIQGETIIKSLPKMVHMLVAGSTGSGKSVFLHSVIVSLMFKCSPSQLRFILIDPKRVEFTIYSGMPHMMLPNAVSNCDKAINALGWAVKEMERRFDSFQTLSVQNIEDYNHCESVKNGEYPKIPYIVIIIDELNELMMTGKKDVEEKITRLSQLGRASGIHMIIATQRPSTDVVTGTIKNNLPTRVAFALQSGIDSRVILDETGAEKLLGRGDMLLAPYDDNVTSRVQGAFMSMDEVRKVVRYIKDHNESYFDEAIANEILADKTPPPEAQSEGGYDPSDDTDELLPQALRLCIDTNGASINMVQRRFRVGYARAARIIDQMELAGYISPGNGSKLRTVYMTLDEWHEKFGEDY